jgi:D-threo-aldose 1-dehydrogenase
VSDSVKGCPGAGVALDLQSRRRVGRAGLYVGPLGMGVAPLGNLYAPVTEAQARETIAAAEAHGIRWFDTAPLYGYGLAEQRLGQFLEGSAGTVISTKVGRVLEPAASSPSHEAFVDALPFKPVFDYSAAGIRRSFEDSLQRLRVERVGLLLLHDIDRVTHSKGHRALIRQILHESLPALQELKAAGRVDAVGLGINEWDVGYEIVLGGEIDCVLLAGRYTLIDQSAHTSGFLDACSRRQVSVLLGGVLNAGFLAGGSHYAYHPAGGALVRRREQLAEVCRRWDVSLPTVALQFSAAHPAVASTVVGMRSAAEVMQVIESCRTEIPAGLWQELRERALIPEDLPLQQGHGAITCDSRIERH